MASKPDEKAPKGAKGAAKQEGAILLTDRLLVSGMTGTGKTYFVKWFIKTRLLGKIKVFIWDPLHQYGEQGRVLTRLEDLRSAKPLLRDSSTAIVFQPAAESDDADTFDQAMAWCLANGPLFVIAEEFGYYMTASGSPPQFTALVKRGRNYGIGILGVTQRPARIDLNYLGVVNHWIIFPQELQTDLDRIADYLRRTDAALDADELAKLPDRHFVHYWRDRANGRPRARLMPPVKGVIDTRPDGQRKGEVRK